MNGLINFLQQALVAFFNNGIKILGIILVQYPLPVHKAHTCCQNRIHILLRSQGIQQLRHMVIIVYAVIKALFPSKLSKINIYNATLEGANAHTVVGAIITRGITNIILPHH